VTHAELQAEVLKLAKRMGLNWHHCDMRRSQAGWPDLELVGDLGVLYRELKVPPDKTTREQRALGYRLLASGQDWSVWTPADLDIGAIKSQLEAIA